MNDIAECGFYREPEILALVGVSHATLWRMIKRGDWPAPVKLSLRAIGWRREEVRQWLVALADKS
jgi:prophage regulatory protein